LSLKNISEEIDLKIQQISLDNFSGNSSEITKERKIAEEQQKKIDEEQNKKEEQRKIAEETKKNEVERHKIAEEQKKNEAEQQKIAEALKKKEDDRKIAEEQKRKEEQRKAEEQKKKDEDRRIAEEQKRKEEQRKFAEEQKRKEEQRKIVDQSPKRGPTPLSEKLPDIPKNAVTSIFDTHVKKPPKTQTPNTNDFAGGFFDNPYLEVGDKKINIKKTSIFDEEDTLQTSATSDSFLSVIGQKTSELSNSNSKLVVDKIFEDDEEDFDSLFSPKEKKKPVADDPLNSIFG